MAATFTFEELVKRYTPLIVRVVKGIVPRIDMVDDVKQEVFIRLFRRYGSGKFDPCEEFQNNIESLSATIKKTSKNTALNYLRDLHSGPNSFLSLPYSDVHELNLTQEDNYDGRGEQLDKMLESFSEEVNQLFKMRRQGTSFKDMAALTGLGLSNVLMIIARTTEKLRETAQAEQNNE